MRFLKKYSHYAISDKFSFWAKNFFIPSLCYCSFFSDLHQKYFKTPSLYAENEGVLWGRFQNCLQRIYFSLWKIPFTIRRFQSQNITISGLKFTICLQLSEINTSHLKPRKTENTSPFGQKNMTLSGIS